MTRKEWQRIAGQICANWTGTDSAYLELMFDKLNHLTIGDVSEVWGEALKTCKFRPALEEVMTCADRVRKRRDDAKKNPNTGPATSYRCDWCGGSVRLEDSQPHQWAHLNEE